ncbi:tetratricopeptide repeat protein [Flagellimonas algicola]|uniref:tetratricopeptide repeat protein n=1 Tax=Flagellimonas algicola TaxID=2583815 RepID=UPI0013866E4F|nr:tetratricopeptide repeat protein [Allomuricauda algicola]
MRELGYAYSRIGIIDSLIPVYNRAIYWAEYANDSSEIAISRIRLASSYRRIGNITKSIELLIESRPFVKASRDIHRESGLLFTLANAYTSNGDYELAVKYYQEAADGFIKAEDLGMYAASIISLSVSEIENGNHKPALQKIPEGITILEEEGDKNGALYGKSHLGYAYYLNKEYNQAIATLNTAIKESQIVDNKILENMNRRYLAQTYIELGENELALKETSIVYKEEKERGISDAYLNILKTHAKALHANNKNASSVQVYQEYITAKDSIFTIEKEKEIASMREFYESEKRENEIALQEEEINTLNEKARADNLQKGLYAGGMTSAIALSGLMVFGFRQRIKKNRIAREKQEEIYKKEIEHKQKELASQTLHLVQKNTFIQELKENLENLKNSPEKFKVEFRRIVMLLKKQNASDKDWEVFKSYFSEVHNDFDQKLKTLYPDISEKEIRLAAFLRMNLTTKEIAATLNVLPDSILKSKYRLKKKLDLDKDMDLTTFLNTL